MSDINSRPIEPIDIVRASSDLEQISFADAIAGSEDERYMGKDKAFPLGKAEIETNFSKLIQNGSSIENPNATFHPDTVAQARVYDPTKVMGTGGGGRNNVYTPAELGRIPKPLPEPPKQVPWRKPEQPYTQPSYPQTPPHRVPVRHPK